MPRIGHTDEDLDALAAYSLGLLEEADRQRLDEHLSHGCGECEAQLRELEETAACMAFSTALDEPSPSLRDRVLALTQAPVQVWKQWTPESGVQEHIVRSEEGEWQHIQPGISVKKLSVDVERDAATMLVRMDPGTSYGRHVHGGTEQCFVLEGDLRDERMVAHAGDFQSFPAGSTHGRQSTDAGCLLLIVSSLRDRMLD